MFDLEVYKKQKEKELLQIFIFDSECYEEITSKKLESIINQIIYMASFLKSINDAKNKGEVDEFVRVKKEQLKSLYKELKNIFFLENFIDEKDITESINYDICLQDFYNNLIKLRDKYSKESLFINLLDNETRKYTNHVWYELLKGSIKKSIEVTYNEAKKRSFVDTEKLIANMHKKILKILSYENNLRTKLKELETDIKKINDENLYHDYKKIIDALSNSISLTSNEDEITKLAFKIKEYYKKESILKENEKIVNDLYYSLLAKSTTILTNDLSILSDIKKIKEIHTLWDLIIKVFSMFKLGKIPIDELLKLNLITFINKKTDLKIINEITKKDYNCLEVYISLHKPSLLPYLLDKCILTKQESDFGYIPLDFILNDSVFIGKYAIDYNGSEILLLYESSDYYIYEEESNIKIMAKNSFNIKSVYKADIDIKKYNKEYIREVIFNQAKNNSEEQENQVGLTQ